MSALIHHFTLTVPLFVVVFIGYGLARWARLPAVATRVLVRVVFGVMLPLLLFRMMAGLSRLPPVDARLLWVFFGSCLLVFGVGRLVGHRLLALDGTEQSVFALGGVFSNNVMLGIPLAHAILGEAAMPAVALVLVFNAFTLWTLVTVSVEWSRRGALSVAGIAGTARGVLSNPLIVGIIAGAGFGGLGGELPAPLVTPLAWIARLAGPLALLAMGASLAQYRFRAQWRPAVSITALKLVVQPLVVWALAALVGLPPMETRVGVLLASLAVGVNVYLMARQFEVMESAVAGALLLSTTLAALTTPLFLTLTGG